MIENKCSRSCVIIVSKNYKAVVRTADRGKNSKLSINSSLSSPKMNLIAHLHVRDTMRDKKSKKYYSWKTFGDDDMNFMIQIGGTNRRVTNL